MRSFISKAKLANEKSGTRISVCRFLAVKGPGTSGDMPEDSAGKRSFSEFEWGIQDGKTIFQGIKNKNPLTDKRFRDKISRLYKRKRMESHPDYEHRIAHLPTKGNRKLK